MRLFPRLTPKIVHLSFRPFGFLGCTLYPFVFVYKKPHWATINHELVHIEQQQKFWDVAGPLGLLAWLFLYFCCLPYKYHPWRTKWELEAYTRGTGFTEEEALAFIKQEYFKRIE